MTRKQVLSAPMMRVPLSFDIRFAPRQILFILSTLQGNNGQW